MLKPLDDKSLAREIGVAVAIAGLSALATKIVDWTIDELREKYGTKKPEKPTAAAPPSTGAPPA